MSSSNDEEAASGLLALGDKTSKEQSKNTITKQNEKENRAVNENKKSQSSAIVDKQDDTDNYEEDSIEDFQDPIGDGKGTFYFDCFNSQKLLNWNVSTFQKLMHPEYYFDNYTMSTFLWAVRFKYRESMFVHDNSELYQKVRFDHDLLDEGVLLARREYFQTAKRVCRILVTGNLNEQAHYQVLIFERELKEVTLIEYTKVSTIHQTQLSGIKDIIFSMGWGVRKNLKLRKSKGRGKNGDLKKKKGTWFYNHIHYAKPCAFASDKGTSDCGPFSGLVYLKIMSNYDPSFQVEAMKYDEYDNANIRWCFIKEFRKLLPQYIEEEFTNYFVKCDINPKDYNHMKYTNQLLSLPEDKLEFAVVPQNRVNCICGNEKHKTSFIFVPSCCFRTFHADCYLKHFCSQLTTNADEIYFCNECKKSKDILLGGQDRVATSVEEIYTLTDDKKKNFEQFMRLTEKDEMHRYVWHIILLFF